MGLFACNEACGVVAAHLDRACTFGSHTVVFTRHANLGRLESLLEIGADGSNEHNHHILIGRLHAHTRGDADFKRTDIERRAGAVGRHETLVELHHLTHHLAEKFHGHGLHLDAFRTADETLCVLFHTEHAHLAVLATESLQALERLLAVVKAGSSDVHRDILGVADLDFAPFAIFISTSNIVVCGHIAESQVAPVDVCLFHDVF